MKVVYSIAHLPPPHLRVLVEQGRSWAIEYHCHTTTVKCDQQYWSHIPIVWKKLNSYDLQRYFIFTWSCPKLKTEWLKESIPDEPFAQAQKAILELVGIVTLLICNNTRAFRRERHSSSSTRRRDRRCFDEITGHMSDRLFRNMFRMSRLPFELLVGILRPNLFAYEGTDEAMEIERQWHKNGKCTDIFTKVAVSLQVLTGSSPLDLELEFDLGLSTIQEIFDDFLTACANRLKMASLPADARSLESCALQFAFSRNGINPLPGCIMHLMVSL